VTDGEKYIHTVHVLLIFSWSDTC